jgi:hypothetical protein
MKKTRASSPRSARVRRLLLVRRAGVAKSLRSRPSYDLAVTARAEAPTSCRGKRGTLARWPGPSLRTVFGYLDNRAELTCARRTAMGEHVAYPHRCIAPPEAERPRRPRPQANHTRHPLYGSDAV